MRPAKVFGNFFVLMVLTIISVIYYTYMFVVWAPRAKGKQLLIDPLDDERVIALLIFYNIIFFMLLWSFW